MATGHKFCVVRVADFHEAWVSDFAVSGGGKGAGGVRFLVLIRALGCAPVVKDYLFGTLK